VPFQDILPDGSTSVREAETRTRGVELEGEWQPVDIFSLGFSITVQEPEYKTIRGLPQASGNTIRRIPKELYRLTPMLQLMDERARVYLTYTRAGDRYSNDINTVELPAYTKLDGGVIFDINDAFSVQLTADNITNEVGLTEGNPRSDIDASGIGALYMARPLFERSYMLQGTVRF
jgi:iron complex outermembrane receptor protein